MSVHVTVISQRLVVIVFFVSLSLAPPLHAGERDIGVNRRKKITVAEYTVFNSNKACESVSKIIVTQEASRRRESLIVMAGVSRQRRC